MRKIGIIAAIAVSVLTLSSSCGEKNESGISSSELISGNIFDSYILLSANEEISDSELDEAARIFGKRAGELRILYQAYVDYSYDIVSAEACFGYDEFENEMYYVLAELNDDGDKTFADVTEELAGTNIPISIWFNGELIYAPLVNTKITNGSTIISGNFDLESASELAEKINSEPLKYDFAVAEYEFETAYK